jgi:hypothetical protein
MRGDKPLGKCLQQRTDKLRSLPIPEADEIHFSRQHESQEADPSVTAGLEETQQVEVFSQALGCHRPFHVLTVIGKGADGILGAVVVPGDAIVMDEGEELLPALQETIPEALCGFGECGLLGEGLGESGHLRLVCPEVFVLQAVFVHGLDDGSQEGSERASDGSEILIEGIVQEELIHVSYQVN